MAPVRASVTRETSSESSAGSNIDVKFTAEDSESEQPSASTPPTSISDSRSMQSSKSGDDSSRSPGEITNTRPKRTRASIGTYNLKQLSNKAIPSAPSSSRKASGLSGRTLVEREDEDEDEGEDISKTLGDTLENALNPDWEVPADSPKGKQPVRVQRKPSVKDRVKNAAESMKTVLGKRTRDMMETGKRKLGMQTRRESPHQNKFLKELDMGPRGVLDEMDLDEDYAMPPPPRPTKRAKKDVKTLLQEIAQPILSGPLQKTSDGKKVKKWHTAGLYVGQDVDADSEHPKVKKLQKKRPASAVSETAEVSQKKLKLNMVLPMFSYLEKDRPFVIPYDVFAPSLKKGDEKPKDWKQLNRNRIVGDAKFEWKKQQALAPSDCVCELPAEGELGCGEDCLNRVMQYECNEDNCKLPAALCGNRPFARLGERIKKGGAYDVGVEVVKTENRGFGIRACRSFLPGEIIMEYTGEIIDEEECQRRMRELYKDKQCYYLMEMEHNLVIDGTKGSMARFINHSCAPNCEVHMIKVNGTPRMAVFAGADGIMTGEELTYDYNFDNFGDSQQKCYCGARTCRGTLSKRLNAAEVKRLAKEEAERKRKADELAKKQAEAEARKKDKSDLNQSAGWRGWVAVDDPEVKAKLREEKRIAEEKAKNSSRAQRLAKRYQEQTADSKKQSGPKKASPRRRKTVDMTEKLTGKTSMEFKPTNGNEIETGTAVQPTRHSRIASTGSRFTEGLDHDQRPTSRQSARGIIRKKTTLSVKTSAEFHEETIEEDEDITVGTIPAISPTVAKDEVEDNEAGAKPKRPSILSSVSAAVNRGGDKVLGSTGGKLRQSTLNFVRKA